MNRELGYWLSKMYTVVTNTENMYTVVTSAGKDIANTFEKPEWLGEEIGYKELSNWKLSNMTKEEWKTKVTMESLENNRKIILDLKKNGKI